MNKNYYEITAEELVENTKVPLLIANSAGEVHYEYAMQMIEEIVNNNNAGKKTVFICPCGPTEQYPIFARLVNRYRISLKNTWIINMDEYLTESGEWIPEDSKFSFHKWMNDYLYDVIDPELTVPKEQRIFPDPKNPEKISEIIEELGGVDMVLGGIALNGHIAFNEPEPGMSTEEFANLPTRVVELSLETKVKDAILGRGGAVDTIADKAISVGMKEILGAKKLRLSMLLDMQRAVIRKACCGEVTSECPVSFIQNHPDAMLMVSKNVIEKPF
ncbi:MAG: glucosamine-6-phosphate isomerase [Monoglobaceae bacterium]